MLSSRYVKCGSCCIKPMGNHVRIFGRRRGPERTDLHYLTHRCTRSDLQKNHGDCEPKHVDSLQFHRSISYLYASLHTTAHSARRNTSHPTHTHYGLSMALSTFLKLPAVDTLLKSLLPASLPSGRLSVPFCRSSLRRSSFIPFMTIIAASVHCD